MIPILTKDGVVSRKIARALGSAMWMYDLTGGWRIGKLHRRLEKDAAFAHLPTMPKERLARPTSTSTPPSTMPGWCSPSLAPRPPTAPSWSTAVAGRSDHQRRRRSHARVRWSKPTGGASRCEPRSSSTPPACGPTRFARSTRARTPTRSDPPRACTSPCRGTKVRNDIAVVIPVPKDKRSLFVVPWGPLPDGTFEHTYVGTTDTDYSGPARRSAVHQGRHRLRAPSRSTRRSPPASPRPTSPACGRACARW